MDQQLPLSESAVPPTHAAQMLLGLNEQACNECKRRKGRCDRQLPECGPCARNKRHCLYEKSLRSPLTRKHLTSVEERLRQAELRIQQMERRAQIAEAKLAAGVSGEVGTARYSPEPDTTSSIPRSAPESAENTMSPTTARRTAKEFSASAQVLDHGGLRNFTTDEGQNDWQYPSHSFQSNFNDLTSPGFSEHPGPAMTRVDTHELEAPPDEADDFSWDEQSSGERPESRHVQAESDESKEANVTDGMASLSVEDRRAGYLGVASGAAMLRLLLPDAEHRRPVKKTLQSRLQAMSAQQAQGVEHQGWVPTPVWHERNIAEIDLDEAINSYFSLYHISYPIVHEPSFRAQYAQVIPRPGGTNWNALAYMVGALGLFTTSQGPVTRDLDLFEAAKANISIDSLETGNLTLVQTLVLMSNYLQKRNKPNSGYNYLGLALHMAMGLGLHKEFHNWRIPPLAMEIRRRVWWCLHVFAVGAMITFGRPLSWPTYGIEVALPLNVHDRDLTNVSTALPPPRNEVTTYTAVAAQARFHLATNDIYSMVISVNFPSAAELLRLDDQRIEAWRVAWHNNRIEIPPKYTLSHSIMDWRYRNFRIIMYRPFVIRNVLQLRTGNAMSTMDSATSTAIERCLLEAKTTITSICSYWMSSGQCCMSAWYGLYFLFQASLIPCLSLRNDPMSENAPDWREQVQTVLNVLETMQAINPASKECRAVLLKLCADFLPMTTSSGRQVDDFTLAPVEESPQTQLSGVYSMMWPSANSAEVDMLMPDSTWSTFMNDLPTESPLMPDDTSSNAFWG